MSTKGAQDEKLNFLGKMGESLQDVIFKIGGTEAVNRSQK